MPKKYDALTKSKITSGLQCHKKLWFNIHQPIKKDKAQLAWFTYTDPKTSNEEKEKQEKLLLDYCSKDTQAVYYLVKYLMEKTKT